ncbi:hypothetical protein GIS00_14180 [Nakamurella sp. YIM 132087]|uniref:Uncharacterized protein n=1 Tax=Nakamurella alba TaxID=2665158 RepID=A0A7K1FLQ8_9ACTN|nr:hypothetical protein [Nakamurella alba]MTD15087.1 hypothetical protein [Nakamurella alba]
MSLIDRSEKSRRAHSAPLGRLQDSFRARRAVRSEQRRLERELGAYLSPSDRLELDAMIERATPEDAADIARIVERSRSRHRHDVPAATRLVL